MYKNAPMYIVPQTSAWSNAVVMLSYSKFLLDFELLYYIAVFIVLLFEVFFFNSPYYIVFCLAT